MHLQCIAVRCSVLQCVAVSFSVLQCVAACCGVSDECVGVLDCARGNLKAVTVCCSVL